MRGRSSRPRPIRLVGFLVLALALGAGLGCKDPVEVGALADAGAKTGGSLGDYYRSLADELETTAELETFLDSLRGIDSDGTAQEQYEQQIAALGRRADLADALTAAYTSLGQLSGSSAPADAETSATALARSVESLPSLADSGVDVSSLFGSVAGDLVRAVQSRQLARANLAMRDVVAKVAELVEREMPIYEGIVEEQGNKVGAVAETLITENVLDPQPLLDQVARWTGLPLAAGAPVSEDFRTTLRQALVELGLARTWRKARLSALAGRSIGAALDSLVLQHEAIAQRRGLDLAQVSSALDRAGVYLDEVEAIAQEERAARTGGGGATQTGGGT